MDQMLTLTFMTAMLAAAFRFATPILLAALGEIFTERSGILNLGIEGVMLGGAFVGFYVMYVSGNMWLTFLAAIFAGLCMGGVLGFFYITLRANQVVVGILFSLMMVGLTSFLYRLLFHETMLGKQERLTQLPIPGLSQIPFLGEILFTQSPLTYLALLLAPVAHFLLYRTEFGLSVRAVGEHPRAADTLGVSVTRLRYLSVLIGCGAAAVGGVFFSLHFGQFLDEMLLGRGYIAVAIVIFGQWRPGRALLGAIIFGLVDAFALRLQALSITVPFQFLLMLPYVLTILALLISVRFRGDVGSPSGPHALMAPYER
ncbi:MAG: ABC transporter permease [Caldilineales bacterium]|nr:ABC transporter permease [Caldilineales bacterium]